MLERAKRWWASLPAAGSSRAKVSRMTALVIVLNWNGWEHTFACLRSLCAASDVSDVWLIDNGSTNDRADEARQFAPGVRVVHLDANYGFAGGMNRAMRLAVSEGYRFAYLLNNDCIVQPGFLQAAVDAAQSSDAAVVGSRIAFADSANSVFFEGDYHLRNQRSTEQVFDIRRVSYVNGAGMLVRLGPLDRCGYFDERYFCYHEEVELCWRLDAAGFPSVIAGGSLIHHHRESSDVDHNALYYRTRNRFLLAERFGGWARFKGKLSALNEAAVRSTEAGARADASQWRALAAAVDDGIRRRFGKRSPIADPTRAFVQLRLLSALATAVNLVRSFADRCGIRYGRRCRTPHFPSGE
jgi:GT2 family glycosyltransferase